MRNVRSLLKQGERIARAHSPEILAGTACAGVATTAYLAARSGYRHGWSDGRDDGQMDPWQMRVKYHWKKYIPPVITGAVTIGCVVMGTRIGMRRTAAMAAAYSISERAFSEYREKVAEKLGEKKETAIRDEIAQDKITATAPGPNVILVGAGQVICYEYFTGRYILSDMEALRRAENEINSRILRCEYANLAEFHYLIGIPPTPDAMDMGWDNEKLMELEFSACLTGEGKPAIEFRYNYLKAL